MYCASFHSFHPHLSTLHTAKRELDKLQITCTNMQIFIDHYSEMLSVGASLVNLIQLDHNHVDPA